MERLSSSYRVFAPDSLGAGKSPAWPVDRVVTLGDEVALLQPVFAAAGNPFFLVGHSYGASVALMTALARPDRIRAIAVYEPTLFALLEEEAPGQAAANGIRSAAADAAAAIDANDQAAAAERFIDYWMGPGTWSRMPEARQAPVAASMSNIAGWARALFSEPTPLRAFRALDIPVLYMLGAQSPPSSRGVARLLTETLANVTVKEGRPRTYGPITRRRWSTTLVSFLARNGPRPVMRAADIQLRSKSDSRHGMRRLRGARNECVTRRTSTTLVRNCS
jgi:pimeloyl-ACP methyl ester carboxylesterase